MLTTVTQNTPALTQRGWEGEIVGSGILQTTQDIIHPGCGSLTHLRVLQLQDGGPGGVWQPLQLIQSAVQTVRHPQLYIIQRQEEGILQMTYDLMTQQQGTTNKLKEAKFKGTVHQINLRKQLGLQVFKQ